jgi:DNA-binding NarL/FixJ family response regulator
VTPATNTLHVLIADDELLGRQRLEDLLRGERNVEVVGSVDSGPAASAAIGTGRRDQVVGGVE